MHNRQGFILAAGCRLGKGGIFGLMRGYPEDVFNDVIGIFPDFPIF